MQRRFFTPKFLCAIAAVATASTCSGTKKAGFEFNFCGTSDFVVKTNNAVSDYTGEHEVKLSAAPEIATLLNVVDDATISEASIEVVSAGAENQATRASGRLEIGPLDGSSRILVGQYTDIAMTPGSSLALVISMEAQTFAKTALKGADHAFKVWVTGSLNSAPADVTLRTRVKLSGKVLGGGLVKNFECIAAPATGGTNTTACNPNPCRNDGGCSLEGGVPTCACAYGFGGLKCEKYRTYIPIINKSSN